MRARTCVAVLISVFALGCSGPDAPEPQAPAPAPPAAQAPAAKAPPPAPPVAKAPPSIAPPANPMPTVVVPQNTAEDPRRPQTACDRHEPGWKWHGTVVEDGKCVVGPCDCVKE